MVCANAKARTCSRTVPVRDMAYVKQAVGDRLSSFSFLFHVIFASELRSWSAVVCFSILRV